MKPLFEAIIQYIPAPAGDINGPLQTQITLMDYNDFLGRIAICSIKRGKIVSGSQVAIMSRDGKVRQTRVSKLYGFQGLKRFDITEAGCW